MHYIKDIFEKNVTEHAHEKFIRYSKGEFVGPLLNIKFQKAGIKIKASFHFLDELLNLIADYYPKKIVHITGSLVWNEDLSQKLLNLGVKYSKVSKSRGIFKYVLDNEVNLKDFMTSMGTYNLLATIKEDEFSIVTKSAFPKPNKGFTNDFCKVLLPVSLKEIIVSNFLFDIKNKIDSIKEIDIEHKIIINKINIPNVDNFDEARRLATREGTLIREVSINKSEEKEITKININV